MWSWNFHRVTLEAPETAPQQTRAPAGPPPLSRHRKAPEPRRPIYLATMAAGVVVLVLLVWVLASRRGGESTAASSGTLTATVRRGDFVRTVRIHGVVEAVQSHNVAAPRLAGPGGGPMVITRLIRPGSRVKRGDLLVELDRQNQIKTALDRQAEYRDLEEQIKKKKADHAAAEARDETELKQAENAVETARLEMRRNEVVSSIDAEKNRQNLEEAEARMAQLRETFELKRSARQADLRILEIQRDRKRNEARHAQRNAERMAIRAPLAGLVVLNVTWKGSGMAEVQEGDEVRPGQQFLQVVDPSRMQVRARINQADFLNVRIGQPVEVRLDAYPELKFPGRVEQLAAIGVASNMSPKVRYFAGVFSIRGNHPNLLPDLSAAVDVEVERIPGALVVPRAAVESPNGEAYVYVKNGTGFDRRGVRIRAMSDIEAAIESGVEEGAVVRLP